MGSKKLLTLLRRRGGITWPQPSSLVGLYLFDEGSGQVANDTSGKGNHGQLGATSGAEATDPTWCTEGLSFDGGDYVILPGNGTLDVAADFTLLMVVYKTTTTKSYFYDGRDSNVGITFMTEGNAAAPPAEADQYYLYSDATTPRFSSGGFQGIAPDAWHLLILKNSGNAASASLIEDGTTIPATAATSLSAYTGNKYIGMRRNASTFLTGKVGIFALWDCDLSAADVALATSNVQSIMADRGVGPDALVIL